MKTTSTSDSGQVVLSASGAAAAASSTTTFVHELNQNPDPHSLAVVEISGTFTSPTFKADVLIAGVWGPARFKSRGTGAVYNGSTTPSDSTTAAFLVDTKGATKLRVYNSAGTITSMVVGVVSGTAAELGGPFTEPTVTQASTGFTYTQTYSTATTTVPAATTHTITDSTAGTPSTTALTALTSGSVYATDVASIRNNFATLAAEQALANADSLVLKKLITSLIDNLQAAGLAS